MKPVKGTMTGSLNQSAHHNCLIFLRTIAATFLAISPANYTANPPQPQTGAGISVHTPLPAVRPAARQRRAACSPYSPNLKSILRSDPPAARSTSSLRPEKFQPYEALASPLPPALAETLIRLRPESENRLTGRP